MDEISHSAAPKTSTYSWVSLLCLRVLASQAGDQGHVPHRNEGCAKRGAQGPAGSEAGKGQDVPAPAKPLGSRESWEVKGPGQAGTRQGSHTGVPNSCHTLSPAPQQPGPDPRICRAPQGPRGTPGEACRPAEGKPGEAEAQPAPPRCSRDPSVPALPHFPLAICLDPGRLRP